MDFAGLISEYGYLAIFLGTLLEGESLVALGGFAAFQGYLDLETLILVSVLGAILGDQLFFLIGRFKGRSYLEKRPHYKAKVAKAQALLERHQSLLIFGSRFMYGFRAVLPVALGMSKVTHRRFFVFNTLSAVIWALIFSFGGYMFGGAIQKFLGNVKKLEGNIALIILFLIIVTQVIFWLRRRKNVDKAG